MHPNSGVSIPRTAAHGHVLWGQPPLAGVPLHRALSSVQDDGSAAVLRHVPVVPPPRELAVDGTPPPRTSPFPAGRLQLFARASAGSLSSVALLLLMSWMRETAVVRLNSRCQEYFRVSCVLSLATS